MHAADELSVLSVVYFLTKHYGQSFYQHVSFLLFFYRSDNGHFFLLDSPVLLALFYMDQPP